MNSSMSGFQETGKNIKKSRLATAIGTDETDDLPFLNIHRNIREYGMFSNGKRNMGNAENRHNEERIQTEYHIEKCRSKGRKQHQTPTE